jgi:hypothetical protein
VHSFPHSKVALVPHGDEDHVARVERIAATELPDGGNPWLSGASMFRDDPLFDDWQRAIANYRREANESADAP